METKGGASMKYLQWLCILLVLFFCGSINEVVAEESNAWYSLSNRSSSARSRIATNPADDYYNATLIHYTDASRRRTQGAKKRPSGRTFQDMARVLRTKHSAR
jgi:hypothetical protein